MSNPSKAKGTRGEYKVRDILRALGYKADRVPCSGAAQGFKGDIKASKDGKEYLIEVKCRRSAFNSLYKFYNGRTAVGLTMALGDQAVLISHHFESVLYPVGFLDYAMPTVRIFSVVSTMEKWLGEASILAVIGDRKPPLFVRYRYGKENQMPVP